MLCDNSTNPKDSQLTMIQTNKRQQILTLEQLFDYLYNSQNFL